MMFFKKHKILFPVSLIVLVLVWQVFSAQSKDDATVVSLAQNQHLLALYNNKQSDEFLTVYAKVYRLLPDDNKGSRHQRFLIYVNSADVQVSVLVAHNIDLASRVPITVGDMITLHGEYEYNHKGGVLHWTHHDPQGKHNGGWIEYKGRRYQ